MTFTADRYCPEVPFDSPLALASLEHLATTGVNWVAFVVTWYQTNASATTIFPISRPFQSWDPRAGEHTRVYVSESPRALRTAMRRAHELGLKVMLKPHVDVTHDERGQVWRGMIQFSLSWFESYRSMMLMWARLAERDGVDMLCVGTELKGTTLQMVSPWHVNAPDSWRGLIAEIRAVYRGKLTLAANWGWMETAAEVSLISFWDDVDYIGCDEYVPLPDNVPGANVSQVLLPQLDMLRRVHLKWNKPVLFTEVGFCPGNCRRDMANPPSNFCWDLFFSLFTQDTLAGGEDAQAAKYAAIFDAIVANSDWLRGVFLWNWTSDPDFNANGWGMCMDPKWKRAETVMRTYFNATQPQPAPPGPGAKRRCKCTL